jgi:hypothetical protein
MIWPAPQIADTLGSILITEGDAASAVGLLRQANPWHAMNNSG